jgi:ferredoxin
LSFAINLTEGVSPMSSNALNDRSSARYETLRRTVRPSRQTDKLSAAEALKTIVDHALRHSSTHVPSDLDAVVKWIRLPGKIGVELNYDTRTTTIPVPHGTMLTTMPLCNFILNADTIIALPKIKTHSSMIMTLATKNMFGAVPGLTKAKYHALYPRKSSFANMLLDVLSVATPDLIIMDGIIGMQGEGPGAGDPVQLGVLLASTDSVAMDLAVCHMLHLEPMGIPTLKQAKLRHLWPQEITYPLLTAEDVSFSGFVRPNSAGYLLTGKNTSNKSPVVTSRCTACGQCHEICPKGAITNTGRKATIDYSKCIRCYACHEVCPEKAIILEDRSRHART